VHSLRQFEPHWNFFTLRHLPRLPIHTSYLPSVYFKHGYSINYFALKIFLSVSLFQDAYSPPTTRNNSKSLGYLQSVALLRDQGPTTWDKGYDTCWEVSTEKRN
jgi:hypothetical protein